VKNWFKAQMTRAKKFQPLAVLNQKLKGLDVFESNDTPPPPSRTHTPSASVNSISATPPPKPPDPEDVVTKTHWQKPTYNDSCSEPICGKRLGAANGSINCRHCGKLFCEEHTMYQMKLSRSAQHEPVRGFWCRVCETCYKSREGYNDHHGLEQDHTAEYLKIRRRHVDKSTLEISRLEKRLTKLTQLLADPPEIAVTNSNNNRWSIASMNPLGNQRAQQRRQLEQSIIDWEDDTTVSKCPFCQQEFTQYTFRRHHCRLCGRVVCGDPKTGCSTEVGLNVAARKLPCSQSLSPCSNIKHSISKSIRKALEFFLSAKYRHPHVQVLSPYPLLQVGLCCAIPPNIPASTGL
jgi:rabenosyn-5